jgi:predicted ATP-binding protein involved in virulence
MLRLNSLLIEDIGGISKASIRFHPKMNVICGPNGVGKTTILDIIAHMSLVYSSQRLKKRVGATKGIAVGNFDLSGKTIPHQIEVTPFDPSETKHYQSENISPADILYLRNVRLFDWQKLQSISSDPKLEKHEIANRNVDGIPNADAKNWFANRYLYSAHKNALSESQQENLKLAMKTFAVLDANTQFGHVEASTNEIIVLTPKGQIPYEYLSSGFKTSITIFWGIIKEIEYRRNKGLDKAADFDGIILIDELELHLHPVWQSKILQSLKTMFPTAQFFITTHSPHIVQSAESGEVLPLEIDDSGNTQVREVPLLEHGMNMWTVEEVLEDIMGMGDSRTDTFNGLMKNFERAILSGDEEEATKIHEHLEGSLHPRSVIRKILALQLASIKDDEE